MASVPFCSMCSVEKTHPVSAGFCRHSCYIRIVGTDSADSQESAWAAWARHSVPGPSPRWRWVERTTAAEPWNDRMLPLTCFDPVIDGRRAWKHMEPEVQHWFVKESSMSSGSMFIFGCTMGHIYLSDSHGHSMTYPYKHSQVPGPTVYGSQTRRPSCWSCWS